MKLSNKKIAITGGIGSGKSTVSKYIEEQGYKVVSCDKIYRELLEDNNFLQSLSKEFGDILTEEGKLDKHKLSALVFNDKTKLEKLNSLTHPLIIKRALSLLDEVVSFCEVPLLFENGFERFFDGVIVVLRDMNQRIASVVQRDKISEDEVKLRIKSQFDYNNCNFKKYYVIHNDGNLLNLYNKTLEILKKLK